MEFDEIVSGDNYRFSSLNKNSFLVTGAGSEYILYHRNGYWLCADEIRKDLRERLGSVLDQRLHVATR